MPQKMFSWFKASPYFPEYKLTVNISIIEIICKAADFCFLAYNIVKNKFGSRIVRKFGLQY